MEEPSDNNIMVLKENTPVGELSDPSNKPSTNKPIIN